ncbi:MAG: hypothetical protein GY742_15345 [Hyphomicrobiales bacterium]|nr:hypothetical protein [Hyphomicrobiales bacterium]
MSRQFSDDVLSVSNDTAFWQGLNVGDTSDIDRVNPARFIKEEAITVPGFDKWVILGEPLVWHQKDKTAALINERFFSQLMVVELTSLKGRLNPGYVRFELLQEQPCEKVVQFLLSSGLVRTFVHYHAELRLTEGVPGKIHRESYETLHFMYTNEEVRTDYKFQLKISRQTGLLRSLRCRDWANSCKQWRMIR